MRQKQLAKTNPCMGYILVMLIQQALSMRPSLVNGKFHCQVKLLEDALLQNTSDCA